MALLEISGLSVSYGPIGALSDVSLVVADGEIAVVLGANGAGKSTLLRSVLGTVRPSAGRIRFGGQDITFHSPHQRARRGLALVPEGRRIILTLTVEENLLVGAHLRHDPVAVRQEIDAIYARFSNLAERRHLPASCLSGGEQQMLAIGRALLANPRLMMLDEPSLGLSPLYVTRLFELIAELNGRGLAVLLVEQNVGKALAVAHTATVLELGRVAMQGDPRVLAANPRLQEAYLGQNSNVGQTATAGTEDLART